MKILKNMALASVLIASASVTVLATTEVVKNIEAKLRPDYNIYIDGEKAEFFNANGDVVIPISYNDTTYLPVRSIGEMMNKTVGWDNDTKTITLDGYEGDIYEDMLGTSYELIAGIVADNNVAEYDIMKVAYDKLNEIIELAGGAGDVDNALELKGAYNELIWLLDDKVDNLDEVLMFARKLVDGMELTDLDNRINQLEEKLDQRTE